jgi:hypothetical protein
MKTGLKANNQLIQGQKNVARTKPIAGACCMIIFHLKK